MAAAGGLANVSVVATYQAEIFDPADLDILECRNEVLTRIRQAQGGNTKHVSGLLMAQALALNSIFTNLAMRATGGHDARQMETYLRLALKAQSQSRRTLEAVLAIGNPPVMFAQQANVAFGLQQVNNGVPGNAKSAAEGKSETPPNKLMEDRDGKWLDTRAKGAPSADDPELETVGKIDRAEDR